jgi:hypothetical protein
MKGIAVIYNQDALRHRLLQGVAVVSGLDRTLWAKKNGMEEISTASPEPASLPY